MEGEFREVREGDALKNWEADMEGSGSQIEGTKGELPDKGLGPGTRSQWRGAARPSMEQSAGSSS